MAGSRDDGTFAGDKAHHPNRGVSRHRFAGGGYVDVMRSPELQRDIDAKKNSSDASQDTYSSDK